MERIVVIANPVASQFTGGAHRDVMAELAGTHNVEAMWPSSAPAATDAAKQAVDDGASVVVAMGGDGMVHHVSQGLVGTPVALAIIPVGTTNVVARLFGIPQRHTKAARLISRSREPRRIGTARLTLGRGETETVHHAVFACGLGLDAEVVHVADSDPYRKYRFGSLHYAWSALSVGLKSYPSVKPHVRFTSGANESVGTTALVQFREVYTYFGRIALRFRDTPPEPMSVLVLERMRRRRVPGIVFNALAHRDLDELADFEIWPDVTSMEFEADPPVPAQADGEGLGMADRGTVEWSPGNLLVIAGD
jgi:diacylglycerol kinase family enzyme